MTFKERIKMEHPEKVNKRFTGGVSGCPHSYGYEPFKIDCNSSDCIDYDYNACKECWDRDIPERQGK